MHFETRSGGYTYPHLDDLILKLLRSELVDEAIPIVLFGETRIKSRRVLQIDPTSLPISDQIYFLRRCCSLVVAVNSFLWPIAMMAEKKMLGLHYVNSDEAHQFWWKSARLITPSKFVTEKIRGGAVLASEGPDYAFSKMDARFVDYHPEFVCAAIERELTSLA
jgi:hypothetical protein